MHSPSPPLLSKSEPALRVVALLPGRFQPVHPGHARAWRALAERFGAENAWMGTSDRHDPPGVAGDHPFDFAEKRALIAALTEVPADRVVRLASPYRPVELLRDLGEPVALVVAVSSKDAGRLRAGRYFRPLPEGPAALLPAAQAGYVLVLPAFAGGLSASTLRRRLRRPGRDEAEGRRALAEVYGRVPEAAAALLLERLRPPEGG